MNSITLASEISLNTQILKDNGEKIVRHVQNALMEIQRGEIPRVDITGFVDAFSSAQSVLFVLDQLNQEAVKGENVASL